MAQIKDVPTDEIAVHVNNCENIYIQVADIMRGIEALRPDTELHALESMASQLRRISEDASYAAETLRKSARRLDTELEG